MCGSGIKEGETNQAKTGDCVVKVDFWKRPYKWLWAKIGGRPWTFIYRDIWHQYEWFPQMQWLFTGALGYALGGWKGLLIAVALYTYGYLNGHFFWGTKYQKGQKGG